MSLLVIYFSSVMESSEACWVAVRTIPLDNETLTISAEYSRENLSRYSNDPLRAPVKT